jgi:hypothetical protein
MKLLPTLLFNTIRSDRIYWFYKIEYLLKLVTGPNYPSFFPFEHARARSNLLGSCTLGTVGHRLWPKSLDMTGSLQQQTAKESFTPYYSWLKRRDHHLKKNETWEQSTQNTLPHLSSHGQAGFCHISARSTTSPATQDALGLPSASPGGFRY